MKNSLLTYQDAHKLFCYDQSTGKLIWKVNKSSRARKGDEAGIMISVGDRRYMQVQINGQKYHTHTIIWLMIYGAFPTHEIDHKNGNGLDNRKENLRDVTSVFNNRNRRLFKNNTTGVCGVHWVEKSKKWRARIEVNKKKISLGCFKTIQEAAEERKKAEKLYGFSERHGKAA